MGRATSEGQRFRVLRPHARGGLGEVYVAKDSELNREVALKQIKEKKADNPESRARFLLEAELTGGLEHPGIVPVYGLGQYNNGRPFYAMRFIRGDSLKEAIKDYHEADRTGLDAGDRSLRLRKLLGRFIDVCDAVEYAHSRGVLHRDLKPGNVMLGKHGETLVVDWGLAKPIDGPEEAVSAEEPRLRPGADSDSSPTQMGSALGTPAYMSPEQAAGRLDLLGPTSDVYSLGATLFTLLTGQLPIDDEDVASTLSKVQRGDVPRLAPQVHPALEAVCVRAMALKPEDRYPSPRALAEDIEHWLADEPVSAYSEPWSSRIARWGRRHRTTVATVAVLLVAALISVSIGTVLLSGANRRIRAAQVQAIKNEQKASDNFRLARHAVDDYLTTVSQEVLLDEPGMQPLRKELLAHALEYYRTFANRAGKDSQLQMELRDAYFRLGMINGLVGSIDEALDSYRAALKINQELVDKHPQDGEASFKLARCHRAIGDNLSESGAMNEAMASYQKAITTLNTLREANPTNPMVLDELQTVYNNGGGIKSDEGDATGALEWYAKSLLITEQLVRLEDQDGEHRNSHAATLHNLALLQHESGDQKNAVEQFQSAIDIREKLITQFPRDLTFRLKLSMSHNSLANTYSHLGKYAESVEHHQRAIGIREQLVKSNPAVRDYRDQLAGSCSNLSSVYRQLGKEAESAELLQRAIEVWRRLGEDHTQIVRYRESLAQAYYNLGNMFLGDPASRVSVSDPQAEEEQYRQAIQHYLSSIEAYEKLVVEFPDVPEYRSSLGSAYNNCGSTYSLLGEDEMSRELVEKGRVIRQKLVTDHPDVPDYKNELASSYSNLAGDEPNQEKKNELLNKSIALRQSLVDDFPNVPEYRAKLAFSLQNIAMRRFLDGEQQAALADFERMVPILEKLAEDFPEVPVYQDKLQSAYMVYAIALRLANDLEAALRIEKAREAMYDELLKKTPQNAALLFGKSRAIEGQGKCHHKAKDYDLAVEAYGRSLALLQPLLNVEKPVGAVVEEAKGLYELRVVALDASQQYARAAEESAQVVKLSNNSIESRIDQARYRALAGQHQLASKEAGEWMDAGEIKEKVDLYNTACIFALSVAGVRSDETLSDEMRRDGVCSICRADDALSERCQVSGLLCQCGRDREPRGRFRLRHSARQSGFSEFSQGLNAVDSLLLFGFDSV